MEIKRNSLPHLELTNIAKGVPDNSQQWSRLLEADFIQIQITDKGKEELIRVGESELEIKFGSMKHKVLKRLAFGNDYTPLRPNKLTLTPLIEVGYITHIKHEVTKEGRDKLKAIECNARYPDHLVTWALCDTQHIHTTHDETNIYYMYAVEQRLVRKYIKSYQWRISITDKGHAWLKARVDKLIKLKYLRKYQSFLIRYLSLDQLPEYLSHEAEYIRYAAQVRVKELEREKKNGNI